MKGSRVLWVFFLLAIFRGSTGQKCATSEAAVKNCTCTFKTDTCCWQNNAGNDFDWIREPKFGRLFANASSVPFNAVARLESSEICASVNVQYSLQYNYALLFHATDTCQLSVSTMTDKKSDRLWERSASTSDYSRAAVINFNSFNRNFKVYFEIHKTRDITSMCWAFIDNVVLHHEIISPSSTPRLPVTQPIRPTTPSSLSSSSPSSSSSLSPSLSSSVTPNKPELSTPLQQPTTHFSEEKGEDNSGLSINALIGIIIALIIVVVVLCVVVILLIRRRRGDTKDPLFKKVRKSKNVRIVPPDENSTQTGGLQPGISHYENADIPESSNYYSMPVDGDRTSAGSHVVVYANEASGAGVFTVEPGSPYYINVSDRDPSRDYWTSLQPPEQDKNLYLSLGADASSASTSKPGHGGYLEGNTSSTYLTPVPDGGKCTEDAPVGRTGFYANSSAKDTYVNTKAN